MIKKCPWRKSVKKKTINAEYSEEGLLINSNEFIETSFEECYLEACPFWDERSEEYLDHCCRRIYNET